MIKNYFSNNPKKIIFLGWHPVLSEKIKINLKNKIETKLICSNTQFKIAKKFTNIEIKSISGLNKNFFKYLKNNNSKSKNTLFISHAFPWLINKNIIKKYFNENLLNIHHSRLPYDSGRAATSWRIMRNDKINSTIIHLIDSSIDNGPVIYRKDDIFPKDCKVPIDYEKYISDQSIQMYVEFLSMLKKKKRFIKINQPEFIGRYNPSLNSKLQGYINWDNSSEMIYRFICAFDDPYEGAKTRYRGEVVKLKDVFLHGGETNNHPFLTGSVIRNDKKWIVIGTTDHNCLIIKKVINKKNKNIVDKIKKGSRFYTNISDIIKSKMYVK